jgi:hypothetical protein
MVDGMRGKLHNALLELELREQDMSRLTTRNAYLEGELKKLEQQHQQPERNRCAEAAGGPIRQDAEAEGAARHSRNGLRQQSPGLQGIQIWSGNKTHPADSAVSAIISVQANKSSYPWTGRISTYSRCAKLSLPPCPA